MKSLRRIRRLPYPSRYGGVRKRLSEKSVSERKSRKAKNHARENANRKNRK